MGYSARDQAEIDKLPERIRDDPIARGYVLELAHSRENRHPHSNHRQYARGLTYNDGSPEEVLGGNLLTRLFESGMHPMKIRYLARVLPRADIEVALKDEQIRLTDYVNLARLRRMSPEELISYTNDYDKRPEHSRAVSEFTRKWTQLEKDLLAWNMGMELGRKPTEEEIEARLTDEILSTGGSHSKRCRAFCYLAHPEWFKKKELEPTEAIQPNP